MRKFLLALLVMGAMLSIATNNLYARGIGVKGAYVVPQDDMDQQEYDSTFSFGIFFDMGTFIFDKLRFKPCVDYASFDNENSNLNFEVYGIHLDWYWYFMGNAAISPFLGFGPTLNYYDGTRYEDDRNDSDAGVDLFAGSAFAISGTPFELFAEGRYKFYDIADRDWTAFSVGLGLQYRF